jgi:hypothetical protein
MLLGLMIPILINSFTEFGIFGETNYGILFYQLIIFLVVMKGNPRLSKFELKSLNRQRMKYGKEALSARN